MTGKNQNERMPIRTCVGCRTRANKCELIRLVQQSGSVIIDRRQRLPGRGAWVHEACIEQAIRRRAIARALRVAGDLDVAGLRVVDEDSHQPAGSIDPGTR